MVYNRIERQNSGGNDVFLTAFFTSEGMDLFPDRYLFKTPHFLYIVSCAAAFVLLMKTLSGQTPRIRKIVVTVCCIVMLALKYGGEVLFIWEWYRFSEPVSSFSHPLLDWRTLISFQICGINNVLLPLVIWLDWKKAKDFVFGSSILGGLAVILYPVGVLYGDPFVLTFPMIRTLVVHFLLLFVPCYLVVSGDFRFDPKRWVRMLIGSLAAIAWAMYGNLFVDTAANNMYLMINPFYGGPIPVLNVVPHGLHVVFLLPVVALGFVGVYAVSGRWERKRSRIRQ